MPFDPEAPLPGAPDPWRGSEMPAGRDAPPYAMTEMISAEPALAERLASRLSGDPEVGALARLVRQAAANGEPVTFTGCGTSEHAAMGGASILQDALRSAGLPHDRVASVQAFELAGAPPPSGIVVAVSHEGGTAATNLAIQRARAAGAETALLTVSDRSPGAALADHVVTTGEQDQSWCHTVGYLSPLVAAAAVGAAVTGEELDPTTLRALLDAADGADAAEGVAAALAGCHRLIVTGSGVDHGSARELALKIEEGAHLPSVAYQLETVRHGHLAATDASTGLVLVLTDAGLRGPELIDRATAVLRSAAALGMPAAAIVAADLGDDLPLALTPAGRLSVPLAGDLPRLVGALLGAAIPLQLLAERMARARGINPDAIGRDDPRQAAAADA